MVCEAACAGVKQKALANCAGGRCDCAGFAVKRGRASGWLWSSLCLMLDGSWWEGIRIWYADANGNEWNVTDSDFGRTHHANTPSSSSCCCCRVQLSPTTQAVRQRPKASTLPAPPATHSNNPPHITYTAALATLLTQSSTSSYTHSTVLLAQTPSVSLAPTATSFACDSPTKSDSRSELRLLQLRLHLHSIRAQHTRFTQ